MLRRVPLLKHLTDLRLTASTSAVSAEDEVMRERVVKLDRLVVVNARIGVNPALHELADCLADNQGQVSKDVHRVTATQHNLIVENHIGADEGRITSHHASAARLVVRVAETENGSHFRAMLAVQASDLKQAKVAEAVAVQRVRLVDDLQLVGLRNRVAERLHKEVVRDRLPRDVPAFAVRRLRRLDLLNVRKVALIARAHGEV